MKIALRDIDQLIDVALAAGQAIMKIYDSDYEINIKDDESPLTQADLISDKIICDSIKQLYPEVFILSEETVNQSSSDEKTFFLIDPLDGTKEFIKKNGEFTVNIALIIESELHVGIVYAPALGELFYAGKGLGAYKMLTNNHTLIGKPLSLDNQLLKHPTLRIVASRSHGSDDLNMWLNQLNLNYDLISYGSSLKFCRLAENSADVYPRFGLTSQWDTAAGQCILECSGGVVLDNNQDPLKYSLSRNILNPNFISYRNKDVLSLLSQNEC